MNGRLARMIWGCVALCTVILLASCGEAEREPDAPLEEPGYEESAPEESVTQEPEPPPPEPEEEPAEEEPLSEQADRVLLHRYRDALEDSGITISGSGLDLREGDHTLAFTLLLDGGSGGSFSLPVEGIYVESYYDSGTFSSTWGGVSLLDEDALAVYTGSTVRLLSAHTLEELGPPLVLEDYRDCLIVGMCGADEGYVAAVAGEGRSLMVWLDASGVVTGTVEAADPGLFRISEIDYYTGEERYVNGMAFHTYPSMEILRFGAPDQDMILLQKSQHSGWLMEDGSIGYLDNYLFFNPADGKALEAAEDFYHMEGDRRYAFLHYGDRYDPEAETGYLGMYADGGEITAAFAFPGPPSYLNMTNDEGVWTVSGSRVEIDNSPGSQFITMDFEAMTGSAEYRITREDLDNRSYAVSPNGRYRLDAANWSGAGDGYWGQLVLVDGETGSIDFLCNLPIRYGGDEASANFAGDRFITAASGNLLRICPVDEPGDFRAVRLELPGWSHGMMYCNSIYDAENGRYLLTYLDQVDIDAGGWHGYEEAVYHVAVFDSGLQLVGDVEVPELEVSHSIYAQPCPSMEWEEETLLLGGIPVNVNL